MIRERRPLTAQRASRLDLNTRRSGQQEPFCFTQVQPLPDVARKNTDTQRIVDETVVIPLGELLLPSRNLSRMLRTEKLMSYG